MNTRHDRKTLISTTVVILAMTTFGCIALAQNFEDDEPANAPLADQREPATRRNDPGRPHPRGDMPRLGGQHGPRGHEPWQQLSEEQIEDRLAFIREFNPDMARKIEHMMTSRRGRHSEGLRRILHKYGPKIEKMMNLKKHDPKLYKLIVADEKFGRDCRQLAMKIRKGNGEDSEDRDELRKMIAEHFDVRQQRMEHNVAKLEKRLLELKNNLELRRQKSSELKSQQFAELVGNSDAVKF